MGKSWWRYTPLRAFLAKQPKEPQPIGPITLVGHYPVYTMWQDGSIVEATKRYIESMEKQLPFLKLCFEELSASGRKAAVAVKAYGERCEDLGCEPWFDPAIGQELEAAFGVDTPSTPEE